MNQEALKNFRTRIGACFVNGIFSKTTDPAFVEIAGLSGLDFVILDMEHGPTDFKTIENHVRALNGSRTVSIVRVSANDPALVARAFDTGCSGVQIPNIGSLTEAKNAIACSRYHPLGNRGVCRFVRAAGYGSIEKQKYFERSNQGLLVLMVEGLSALNQIDQIISLDGFDVLFVGPYDLSQALGMPGRIDAVEIQSLLRELSEKLASRNKYLGTFYENFENRKKLEEFGVRYFAYSVDTEIFRRACSRVVREGMNDV